MPHTFVCSDYYCVFTTKNRSGLLLPDIRDRLFVYFGGMAQNHRMNLLAVGGMEDHVHLMLGLPAVMSVAHAMKLVKGASAHWLHQTFPEYSEFSWQNGYGAFSVSRSQRSRIVHYILNQVIHHQNMSFEEEFRILLERHGLKS